LNQMQIKYQFHRKRASAGNFRSPKSPTKRNPVIKENWERKLRTKNSALK